MGNINNIYITQNNNVHYKLPEISHNWVFFIQKLKKLLQVKALKNARGINLQFIFISSDSVFQDFQPQDHLLKINIFLFEILLKNNNTNWVKTCKSTIYWCFKSYGRRLHYCFLQVKPVDEDFSNQKNYIQNQETHIHIYHPAIFVTKLPTIMYTWI